MQWVTAASALALSAVGVTGLVAHIKTRKPSYRTVGVISCAGAILLFALTAWLWGS